MRNTYGPKTNVLCRGCKRKVFFTEAEVTETGTERAVTIECTHKTCSLYGQPAQYDEVELEIHGLISA